MRDEPKMLNSKHETLNSKQTKMTKTQNSKPHDLGDRTLNGFRASDLIHEGTRIIGGN
jgi:hypothetical protein